jgi:hypothetical protein
VSDERATTDDATVPKRFILAGAVASIAGIALSAIGQASVGSIASVVGMALLIGGLHTFGRAGPERSGAER